MALRLQLDSNNGIIYMTTFLDDVPLNTTFIGASPESLESTADALYETANEMRKALEKEEASQKAEDKQESLILTS